MGAILLIIVFFSSENPASREYKHLDCHCYWSANAAQVIQNSGSAPDRNCSPEVRALQAGNLLKRDGLDSWRRFRRRRRCLFLELGYVYGAGNLGTKQYVRVDLARGLGAWTWRVDLAR